MARRASSASEPEEEESFMPLRLFFNLTKADAGNFLQVIGVKWRNCKKNRYLRGKRLILYKKKPLENHGSPEVDFTKIMPTED